MSCCSDIDECARHHDDCSAEEKCMNTDGGFSCICREGYRRVGYRKCAGKTNVQFVEKSCGMSELSRFAYSLTASDRKYYWLTPFYSRGESPTELHPSNTSHFHATSVRPWNTKLYWMFHQDRIIHVIHLTCNHIPDLSASHNWAGLRAVVET